MVRTHLTLAVGWGPQHMGLSTGLLEHPHNMAAGFPQSK